MIASPRHFVVPLMFLAVAVPYAGRAAQPQTVQVWPAAAPGEKGDVGEEHFMPAAKASQPDLRPDLE